MAGATWNIEIPTAEYIDRDYPRLEQLINEVRAQPRIALDTETTGLNTWKDMPLFWSLAWPGRRVTLHASVMPLFQEAFDDPRKYWYFANAKFDLHMTANYGCPIQGHVVDVQVMHALLHDDRPHALKSIAEEVKGWRWSDFKDTFRPRPGFTYQDAMMEMFHADRGRLVEYAANDAYATFEIGMELDRQLHRERTYSLYPDLYPTLGEVFWRTEMPFTRVLWKMERKGIKLDFERAERTKEPISQRMAEIEKRVAQLKGASFNLGSRPDLIQALVVEEGLRPLSYTKGGKSGKRTPSLDEEFFKAYRNTSELASLKYEYDSIRKVKSTFIDGLLKFADPNQRVHTSYKQDTARTGRLSSKEPALQVIPNADNDEYALRKMFVAGKGKDLICRDYNALEMRLLACASMEPGMIQVFSRGWDIHMGNAAMVFDLNYDDIAAAKAKKDSKQPLTDAEKKLLKLRGDIKVVGFGGPSVQAELKLPQNGEPYGLAA
jgi:DNA polymerase-1